MFGRDYSKFSEDHFRDDVSIQNWKEDSTDANVLMSDFVWRLDGCSFHFIYVLFILASYIKRLIYSFLQRKIKNPSARFKINNTNEYTHHGDSILSASVFAHF